MEKVIDKNCFHLLLNIAILQDARDSFRNFNKAQEILQIVTVY